MTIWIATTFQPSTSNSFYSSAKIICATVLIISSFICQTDESKNLDGIIEYSEDIYRFVVESDSSKKALVLDSDINGEYWAFVSASARHARDFFSDEPIQPMVILTISKVNDISGLMVLDELVRNKKFDLSSVQFKHYREGSFESFDIRPIIRTLIGTVEAGGDQTIKVKLNYEDGVLSWDLYPKEGVTYSAVLWPEKPSIRFYIMDMDESGSYPWNIDRKVDISISFQSVDARFDWVSVSPKIIFYPRQEERIWEGKTDAALVMKRLNTLLLRLEGKD